MARIDSIKNKENEIIYPKTLDRAVYNEDGIRYELS